jgi:hypothetical protein
LSNCDIYKMDLLKIMKLLGFKYYMSVSEWVRERIVKFISQKILLDISYTRIFFFFFFCSGKIDGNQCRNKASSKWQSSLSIII